MASIEEIETKKGKVKYKTTIKIKGFTPMRATFDKISDAKKWAAKNEALIRSNKYSKEPEKHILFEAIEKYKEKILPSKKGLKNEIYYLNFWSNSIGNMNLSDITPVIISENRDILAEKNNKKGSKLTGSTINRYLSSISNIFNIAIKEWQWVTSNPVQNISRKKESTGRIRFLSEEERNRLLDACAKSNNKFLETIVIVCLSTGARKMEILNLKWNDVDLKKGLITLNGTKNGETRKIPLMGYALEKMNNLYSQISTIDSVSEFIFYSKNYYKPIDIRDAWERAIKISDIKDFRFHDLRHSAASYLAMNGASILEIANILGHKTLHMVKRYSHLSESHVSDVVKKMNEKIFIR